MQDSIAAIATASGTGGIAVIRISGEKSLEIAKAMFKPSSPECSFEPNYMYPGNIYADGFIDYGFLVYFRAPKSFTGEDVVEFHCHGGVQVARRILKKTLNLGARAAEKGEFTRRAFLNGKLSLASAEGMADMINAESSALLRAGSMLYSEKLTESVRGIQDALKDILAAIAAEVDYPEEDLDGLDFEKIKADILALNDRANKLSASYGCGKKIKNGITVAICGRPNVGKSSLLNALLGYDRAIVSPEAGTTRDSVEGRIELNGILYNFIDTAGIRERAGTVESIGIERAKNIIRSADLVLVITDGEGDNVFSEGEVISVFNKCDLIEPFGNYDIAVSAKTGEGLDDLKKLIVEKSVGEQSLDKAYIVEERHFYALRRAEQSLKDAVQNIGFLTADLIAVDLREAWEALGEITGETASEEIINTVFEKFCVGK